MVLTLKMEIMFNEGHLENKTTIKVQVVSDTYPTKYMGTNK